MVEVKAQAHHTCTLRNTYRVSLEPVAPAATAEPGAVATSASACRPDLIPREGQARRRSTRRESHLSRLVAGLARSSPTNNQKPLCSQAIRVCVCVYHLDSDRIFLTHIRGAVSDLENVPLFASCHTELDVVQYQTRSCGGLGLLRA